MPKMTRRNAVVLLAAGTADLLLGGCRRYIGVTPTFQRGEARTAGGAPLDPIASIPENSIKGPQHVSGARYRLRVRGLVRHPREWRYDEVLDRFPHVERVHEMTCVEGWRRRLLRDGVLLRAILADAGVKPGASVVIFRAADGYATSLPLRYVLDADLMLAFMVNRLVLGPDRGFPLQLIAAGKWGYKSCKWVEDIELSSDVRFRGYWESRGYSNDASLGKPFFG